MKKTATNPLAAFTETLTDGEKARLAEFREDFEAHCLMAKGEKDKLWEDFRQAIGYYTGCGLSLERALELLDISHLGSFYARPSALWFPLDDAAKIYPLSMEHGRMSVFRLSVYLKDPVVPPLLQMALHFTVRRFPSFATTVKKGFFWHYLDTTKRRFEVQQEEGVPCRPLGIGHSGSQSFRVLYWENRISVEFFHVLTDGTGGMTFLKVLTAEYLRLLGVEFIPGEQLWDVNAPPQAEEFENAFTKVPRVDALAGFVDKPAVQMNGRLQDGGPCRVLHFKMDTAQLKAAADRCGATVTAYLLALMFLSGKAATDDLQGESSIQVPVNMRKFYPSETVRNFSMYCSVRLPIPQVRDVASVIGPISDQLREKASRESMTRMVAATEKLVDLLQYIPLAVKQPVAKAVYGFLGDKVFTNTLSNLGVVQLPEPVARQVESMDFVLGTAITNRAGCGVVTVNGVTTFSVTKMTRDPSFEEKLYQLLLEDGIAVSVEGSGVYEG